MDDKKRQSLTFLKTYIIREFNKTRNQMQEGSKNKFKTYINQDEIQNKFRSTTIINDLNTKYIKNTRKDLFESSLEYIMQPEDIINKEIDNLLKNHLGNKLGSYQINDQDTLQNLLHKAIFVIDNLKLNLSLNKSSSFIGIESYFNTNLSNMVENLDLIAKCGFDMVYSVLKNTNIQCNFTINEHIIQFVFNETKLSSIINNIQSSSQYKKYPKTYELSDFLVSVLDSLIKEKRNMIYSLDDFFDTILETLKNLISTKNPSFLFLTR